MQQKNYQTVIEGRPLLYFLMDSAKSIEEWEGYNGIGTSLNQFRNAAQDLFGRNPYIVLLGGHPDDASKAARSSGCDAISTYVPIMKGGSPISWQVQEDNIERLWAAYAATGVPVVVNCATGWDQRPRLEMSRASNSGRQDVTERLDYTTIPTSQQLTAHLQAAANFTRNHQNECPSQCVLIYSWDECDEGGNAIIPSYSASGPNPSVLAAVRGVKW
jgi:hypothetical protein